jgi:uncharacterized protein YciI
MNARTITALLILAFLAPAKAFADQAQVREQYVYVLRLAPRYQEEAAWTDTQNAVIARHFERLSEATRAGKVIIAGRTTEALDKTFGLVIFEADNEADAREFMLSDPAVVAQLMTATLHPYAVALQRE